MSVPVHGLLSLLTVERATSCFKLPTGKREQRYCERPRSVTSRRGQIGSPRCPSVPPESSRLVGGSILYRLFAY